MKKLFLGLFLTGAFAAVSAQSITFDKTTLEYGDIAQNSNGERFFTITNTGNKPLVLTNVKASCGCTTPEWSKDPILPGKSVKLKVGYDTKLTGTFKKLIEVYSNDPESQRSVIWIKGNVLTSQKS
ncbi:DUF1573 domain-containing protein [Elizabethkingia meningoseptica]|uniref:DUF1573 domain-containing protein n=1 Tax=Elizabethkingia meningoseptica TaxID=238 RepID=A0A1V3TZ09_ELIME|nr:MULTISPECIES: DUF1573 domain-containing protein [Elizabethkingia]AQX04923.1 hypothetical protein BBD33_06555 [Elizabethkingia meningoseptica]AQX12380.1 hypothetical protein BBD35_08370 [Elizabethkingia meningoseptica]AQX46965.1 hypothetical protein B5G46_06545 [Elizabethkingia meningoseptica]EJK5329580.1 DUF1573 domain-containing protein [Elizabethkingia meningoseptica]EOR30175.1 hypothetical protein L100_07414 [Elizabethkingia meningoseptica ATCC 13253 = NBRC 12535]